MDNTNKLELYMGRIASALEHVACGLMALRLEVKQAVDKLDAPKLGGSPEGTPKMAAKKDYPPLGQTKMSAFVKKEENNE